jgi:hypothetical protein
MSREETKYKINYVQNVEDGILFRRKFSPEKLFDIFNIFAFV